MNDHIRQPHSQAFREVVREHLISKIDRLLDLHDETAPSLGIESEVGKSERAEKALLEAGELFRDLSGWAIQHFIGHALGHIDPLAPHSDESGERGYTQLADSHRWECDAASMLREDFREFVDVAPELGGMALLGGADQPAVAVPYPSKGSASLNHRPGDVTLPVARVADIGNMDPKLARRMLDLAAYAALPGTLSFRLHGALWALDQGYAAPMFRPAKIRMHGEGGWLKWQARIYALCYVEYWSASGMRKSEARANVAEAYGLGDNGIDRIRNHWLKEAREKFGGNAVERWFREVVTAGKRDALARRKDPNAATDVRFVDEQMRATGTWYSSLMASNVE